MPTSGNDDQQAYIFASSHVLFIIAKAKASDMLVFSPKLVGFPSVLSLVLLSHFPLVLSFPTALLPRSRHRSMLIRRSYFSVFQPEATCPSFDETLALRSFIPLSALPFLPLNFSWLPQIAPRPLPLA